MKKFKLNSNPTVLKYNSGHIKPMVGKSGIYPRSISFTKDELDKLAKLRAKYKVSKSAVVRILLSEVEV